MRKEKRKKYDRAEIHVEIEYRRDDSLVVALPSRTFCVTVKVLPVSRGTVQFTGSGERMIICSGDLTLVGSGGLFITGSSFSHGLAVAGAGACVVCDGGVDATLESPPVTSPFTWGSAVTGTFDRRFNADIESALSLPTPGPREACTRWNRGRSARAIDSPGFRTRRVLVLAN